MFPTVYSLNLSSYGNDFAVKGIGSNLYPSSLGTAYSDVFHADKAPTQEDLLSNLVGTAFRCANLNSNLLATSRLRLYLKTPKGAPKAKFVEAHEGLGRRVTAKVAADVRARWKITQRHTTQFKSALMDAAQDRNDLEEVLEHPILDLLRAPEDNLNDGGLTGYDHRWATQCLLETLGRAYWYVKEWKSAPGMKKIPSKVILLRSQLVREMVDQSGKRYIDHYEYGTNRMDCADVIRFCVPDPSNPHLGFLPPMRTAWSMIKLQRGGEAFLQALLKNGGYPAGIYTPKGDSEGGGIGAAEAKRIQSSLRSGFSMGNAGRIAVMESPGQLQSIAFKPAEIIDVQRARELAGSIADCFDVPRTKLFRDTSNRAAGESGDMDHAKDAGLSRCSRFEETLNSQLIPLFDDSGRLFLAFDSPLPAERTLILDETRTGGTLGLTDINEGREALGYEPLESPIGTARLLGGKDALILPDGTLLGDLGALDLATAEATLNPPAPPKDPNAKPPAPKKPGKSQDRKILERLTEVVELMAKDAKRNTDHVEGRLEVLARSAETPPVDSSRANEKQSTASYGDVSAALKAEGYSEEEIAGMKGRHTCKAEL